MNYTVKIKRLVEEVYSFEASSEAEVKQNFENGDWGTFKVESAEHDCELVSIEQDTN
jgi:hypothetical protein